jgi:hypothetical protein
MLVSAASIVALTLLPAGCAVTPQPPPASPTSTEVVTTMRSLDPHSRGLLDQARGSGVATVPVLILAAPGSLGELTRRLSELGATVRSADERLGSVRAEVPAGAVDRIAALPSVTAVQVLEDVELDDPTP